MSYGNPPAPRRSGLTTAGKWMFIIGLVLSVIVGIGVAWGGVQGARMFSDFQEGGTPMDGGQATVSMEEGDLRLVTAEGSQTPTCTVTGPDGTESALTQDSTFDTGDQQVDAQVVGTYQATATGEHTFTCEGGTTSLSPSISIGATIGLAVAGLGILALIPLLLLTGIGLILWLVGRSRDRMAADGPPGGYGYGHGNSNAYPQQGYGQPQDSGYPQAPGQGYGQQYGQGSPPRPPGQDPTDPYRRD